MNKNSIPIIAIDGTTASGKGTIAYRLAKHLGYNYLNSGALYRLVAYVVIQDGHELHHTEKVIEIAKTISPKFEGKKVIINGQDIWPIISSQHWGQQASIISPVPKVREAIFEIQRSMIKHPGLVAEGRDMCTHVFTDAHAKLYLDAHIEERARRRHKDEIRKKSGKSFEEIVNELRIRDERDKDPARGHAQLRPADDGYVLDTSNLDVNSTIKKCIAWCKEKGISV
jgi:cytidylate kinase